MKDITTYLQFDGNCREAMTFYGKCLGYELHVMPFSEMPESPPEAKDRLMHAALKSGPRPLLMASDTMPGTPFQRGNNFSICIQPESQEEASRLFTALSEKGNVTMPLQDTFWGAHFGMLTDQFGINWMVNYEKRA